MLGEFLMRLAIALPLVCALAVLCLWVMRQGQGQGRGQERGRLRLPMLPVMGRLAMGRQAGEAGLLEVLDVRAISPSAKLAVIRFDGRAHLVGVAGQSITLLAPAEAPGRLPAAGTVR
jgi:flagellar biogenesis protein FliO